MSDQNEAGASEDVMDESLGRLADTRPDVRGALSNHGPMATEAMIRLGRADAIEPWLDGYIQRLESAPRATDVIAGQTWRDALGVPQRGAAWELYLPDQPARQPLTATSSGSRARRALPMSSRARPGVTRSASRSASPTGNCTCGTSLPGSPGVKFWRAGGRAWCRAWPPLQLTASSAPRMRPAVWPPRRPVDGMPANGWPSSPAAWRTGPPAISRLPATRIPRGTWTWTLPSAACRSLPGRCSRA